MKAFTLPLDREKSYLLGLSGGADSVCLFHLLLEGGYGFAAAHVNHGIRGKEADRDAEFCRNLCRKHGVALFEHFADVPAIAKESGKSLEEAARDVRYAFFKETASREGISVLLTAHNADDNAETLLLALTRGCSPSGACGVAPRRELDGLTVERPLLSYSKAAITELCRARGYDFVTDSTNSDISYPRNRVRQNVLPELGAINPEFLAAFLRFTEQARADSEYLDKEAEACASDPTLSDIAACPRVVAKRALAIAAHRAGASPETVHVEAMLEMAIRGSGSVSLPGAIRAECRSGRIVFSPDTREKDPQIYPKYEPITLEAGENQLPSGKLTLIFGELTNDFSQIYNLSISAHINPDRIKGRIYARPRREGDRILVGGMHRSVKKLISEKLSWLSLEARRSLPVVCDGEEIIWVPYLEASDPFRGKALTLIYTPSSH